MKLKIRQIWGRENVLKILNVDSLKTLIITNPWLEQQSTCKRDISHTEETDNIENQMR